MVNASEPFMYLLITVFSFDRVHWVNHNIRYYEPNMIDNILFMVKLPNLCPESFIIKLIKITSANLL